MRLIALIGNNEIFRIPLKLYLESTGELKVIVEATNAKSFFDKVGSDESHPEIVLIDYEIPATTGIETIRGLKKRRPEIKSLLLTPSIHSHLVSEILTTGADGIVTKSTSLNVIHYCVEQILKGEKIFVDREGIIAQTSLNNIDSLMCLRPKLTERQKYFLILCGSPKLTYKDIAAIMQISNKTVDRYRDDLFKKLKICSRTGLAIYAYQNGFIDFL